MTQTAAAAGRADAYSIPLDKINVADPALFRDDTVWPYFERLRKEDPIHYCKESQYGPYWSVTKFKDIMSVDTNHKVFSAEARDGGITILDNNAAVSLPMFIAMDPPKHDVQRKAVSPIFAQENLAKLEGLIRQRTQNALDALPIGETFNWVERVSINLTTQMLATLFGFPFEERTKLTRWSDIATCELGTFGIETEEQRIKEFQECGAYMSRLFNERAKADPQPDLLSMLAHSESTRNMTPEEFMGNMVLLVVGGNDTTRNSMSGGVLALNQYPEEYRKLCANPALIPSMVSEIIRWQTPLSHIRRTALQDFELGGKQIKKGDKVVMWYASGNRDEEAIENANQFIIDRANPRQHLSFGFGIHRCVGNRLAEMQLRVLWEEALKRWPKPGQIEVVGEPQRYFSPLMRGFEALPVRINA
uniref:Cytochrome 450 cyclohexane monooxygenase n=1 Tax=Acidovorax sp. CHX100 TaxID=1651872 RepID=A0A0G3FKE8_9BURK|nr:cytochrome 450 cyclohexane monooxygenase [Acidovorax sp. CHX100]